MNRFAIGDRATFGLPIRETRIGRASALRFPISVTLNPAQRARDSIPNLPEELPQTPFFASRRFKVGFSMIQKKPTGGFGRQKASYFASARFLAASFFTNSVSSTRLRIPGGALQG